MSSGDGAGLMPAPNRPNFRGVSTTVVPVRIIDGDTIVLDWLGDNELRGRLDRCWVEDGTSMDERAAEYLTQFMGKPLDCVIRTDVDDKGRPVEHDVGLLSRLVQRFTFQRALIWLWEPGEDESINDALIRMGFATLNKPKG